MNVVLILAVSAFITTIVSAIGRCPVWVPVMLLCLLALLQSLPIK